MTTYNQIRYCASKVIILDFDRLASDENTSAIPEYPCLQYSRQSALVVGRMATRQHENRRIHGFFGARNIRVDAGQVIPGTPVVSALYSDLRAFPITNGTGGFALANIFTSVYQVHWHRT